MPRHAIVRHLSPPPPRLTGTWLGLGLAVVIAGLGVAGLLVLNRLAENAHAAEQILTRLELQTARLHSWDRRVVLGQSDIDELPAIQERADEVTLAARRLEQLASSDHETMRFVAALADYRAALDDELAQFAAGDLARVTVIQRDLATPLYDTMAAALTPSQTATRARAERVSWLVAAGSVTTLMGALAATGILVWGIERARRATERRGEARFRALVQNATDLVAIVDPDATLRYASPAAEGLLGVAPEELVGRSLMAYTHPEDQPVVHRNLELVLSLPRTNLTVTFRVRHWDGSLRQVEATLRDLRGERGIAGVVLNVRDVSERKALEDELAYRAFHDGLTELPNRTLLVDRLRQALARGMRRDRGTAVVFIDLDDFKMVNDSLGHDTGDQLLVGVAQRLRASVRPGDTVARLGGDEFIVLLEDVADESEALGAADRCREQLRSPFVLDGRELFIGASVGVAFSGRAPVIPEELLRQADLAMYAAKARGKGQLAVFDPTLDTGSLERIELQADLRRAIERHELRLHYQPIVHLKTRQVRGVEALLRWYHPERGLVPPDQFIPLAEQTGMIVPIGRWVLREACRQAREWQIRRAGRPWLAMSVNISGRQFQHPGLVADVAAALQETGLTPACLKLEITESVAMEAGAATIETLQGLKGLGIQLAIDDFGTGYSSLSYLKRFPVDTLKIDRSFVDGLSRDAHDTAIVRSVIAIARSLELSVTAEGVETAEQLSELQDLACDEGQGFYFARPQARELIDRLVDGELEPPAQLPHAA